MPTEESMSRNLSICSREKSEEEPETEDDN
jgi:hypothetical protein